MLPRQTIGRGSHPAVFETEPERRRAAALFLRNRGHVVSRVWSVEVDRILFVDTSSRAKTAVIHEAPDERLSVARIVEGWPVDLPQE